MMNSLRKVFFIQLMTGIRPRLLSRAVDKDDSQKKSGQCESKDKPKKQEDICGKAVLPTGPRCKNKPDGAKSGAKSDAKSDDKSKKPGC